MEADSPFRDVPVDAVLQVLFHAGSPHDKIFEGGLHAIAPAHIPHKETLIHLGMSTEWTSRAHSKLVNTRMLYAAT